MWQVLPRAGGYGAKAYGWPAHDTGGISKQNEGNTYAVRAMRWVKERSRNGVKG